MDRFILTRNVAHFRELLAAEKDPDIRSTIEVLLAETTHQLAMLDTSDRPGSRNIIRNSDDQVRVEEER